LSENNASQPENQPRKKEPCSMVSQDPGLYIHIPFCLKKCPYCDFYSLPDLSLKSDFINALVLEFELRSNPDIRVDTVYLGGGTPSLLAPSELEIILAAVKKCFRVMPGSEITMEINPGTVQGDYFDRIRSLGINRLNVGVQSFQDEKLKFLQRIHMASSAVLALDAAAKAGFDNIGLDMIYGLPSESETQWVRDIESALAFQPRHLSCYMLTYEPGTPMHRSLSKGEFAPLDHERLSSMFVKTSGYLKSKGYLHYEISNFASDLSFRSRHNRKYWNSVAYLGAGPSAHSFNKNRRSWNHRDIRRYIADLNKGTAPVADEELLSREQRMIEIIMLGLRTLDGVDVNEFESTAGMKFYPLFKPVIKDLEKRSWGGFGQGRFFLTLEGMSCLDSIIERFARMIFQDR